MVGRGKPYLVGTQEFAALYGVEKQMPRQWISRGALDRETAVVISGQMYWPLGVAVEFGKQGRGKALDEEVLARLRESQGPGWTPAAKAELPPIVGQQELVEVFRLPSQPTLVTAIDSGRFPPADWQLGGSGGLWLLDTVLGEEALARLRETARSLPWVPDEEVVRALREGRYDGPGAVVLPRGRMASK
ncbi:hypothetical protein AB0K51_09460 [Kitasatospora sp. NPDC049285]|uniref:hypothetical protein n=1 Tax=Kitasatospora sp. NPDC049285 TaxID=3157096 RepID=UPI00343DF406